MAKQPPRIKAALAVDPLDGGERIVLVVKSADREAFQDLLMKVKALPGARFDWDEKVWHLPLTKRNADKVIAMAAEENVEIAPLLAAWIADRSYLERLVALEAAVAELREAMHAPEGSATPPF